VTGTGDALLALGAGDGPAPPSLNGELVFEAPWEARVFGMAHRLCDAGLFTWDEFRQALIAEIGRWEQAHPGGAPYAYFERFQAALEALLTTRGLMANAELWGRAKALAARPHGHDHG
jgi:nitrile hydratase accessory protein